MNLSGCQNYFKSNLSCFNSWLKRSIGVSRWLWDQHVTHEPAYSIFVGSLCWIFLFDELAQLSEKTHLLLNEVPTYQSDQLLFDESCDLFLRFADRHLRRRLNSQVQFALVFLWLFSRFDVGSANSDASL